MQAKNKRLTVGFFIQAIDDTYGTTFWQGIWDASKKLNVDVICFTGYPLKSSRGYEIQANIVYDFATKENLDGLIIVGGLLNTFIGEEERVKFLDRYRPLPMVSLHLLIRGIPGINCDSYDGAYNAVEHLIKEHNKKHIAFISGPQNNINNAARYKAFCDAYKNNGLILDPNLVSLPGNYDKPSGEKAIKLFLDERKINIDAIFAANDFMAVGAMETLQKRKIKIPEDIALIGFDDSPLSPYLVPSLTSVKQPFYEMAYEGLETLVSQIKSAAQIGHQKIDEIVKRDSHLFTRQSCGCFLPSVLKASSELSGKNLLGFSFILNNKKKDILIKLNKIFSMDNLNPAWIENLLDGFVKELYGRFHDKKTYRLFIKTLDIVLKDMILNKLDVIIMNDFLSEMRKLILPHISISGNLLYRAEDLWQQGRVIIGSALQNYQARQRMESSELDVKLRKISNFLITSFDIGKLIEILSKELQEIGIESCFISLYDNPQKPLDGMHLVMNFCRKKLIDVPHNGLKMKPGQFIPDDYVQSEESSALIVTALYFCNEPIGILVFDCSKGKEVIYENLRYQLSSALKGALLLQQIKDHDQILSSGIENQTSRLDDMTTNIDIINSNMENQSSAVIEEASSIEEMVRNIDEITKMANKVREISANLNQIATTNSIDVKKSIEFIQNIHKDSRQILEFLSMIKGIAEQTNVLAINAAIQASHAGEYGKGFGVVAEEIRKMADSINTNIKSIEIVLNTIVKNIDESKRIVEKTGIGLDIIVDNSSKNSDISQQLNTAMIEQNNGAKEILKATQQLVSITDKVKNAVKEQKIATDRLNELLKELRKISKSDNR
jgi:DNA-binding LacI/PurR family transcriptional regulator